MANFKPIKIILIEDDPGHQLLIKENLRAAGIHNEIDTYNNGEFFFEKLMNNELVHTPEELVILLDLNLPGMHGTEILEKLKKDKEKSIIPIAVLTSTDDQREIDNCYRLGCNVYIQKPVNPEQFQEAMRQLGFLLLVVSLPKV